METGLGGLQRGERLRGSESEGKRERRGRRRGGRLVPEGREEGSSVEEVMKRREAQKRYLHFKIS